MYLNTIDDIKPIPMNIASQTNKTPLFWTFKHCIEPEEQNELSLFGIDHKYMSHNICCSHNDLQLDNHMEELYSNDSDAFLNMFARYLNRAYIEELLMCSPNKFSIKHTMDTVDKLIIVMKRNADTRKLTQNDLPVICIWSNDEEKTIDIQFRVSKKHITYYSSDVIVFNISLEDAVDYKIEGIKGLSIVSIKNVMGEQLKNRDYLYVNVFSELSLDTQMFIGGKTMFDILFFDYYKVRDENNSLQNMKYYHNSVVNEMKQKDTLKGLKKYYSDFLKGGFNTFVNTWSPEHFINYSRKVIMPFKTEFVFDFSNIEKRICKNSSMNFDNCVLSLFIGIGKDQTICEEKIPAVYLDGELCVKDKKQVYQSSKITIEIDKYVLYDGEVYPLFYKGYLVFRIELYRKSMKHLKISFNNKKMADNFTLIVGKD